MTREEAKTVFLNRGYVEVDNGTYYNPDKWREACAVISEWLKQEPCDDVISRQAVINAIANTCFWLSANNWEELMKCINSISPINSQQEALQFANWVASEIFDENWEYNQDAFAELACRKLAKLDIVRANGDEWELIEPHTENEVRND